MRFIQACCAVVLALVAPPVVWAQATPAAIVEPPRQQMQTVAPNVPVGAYLANVTGKTPVHLTATTAAGHATFAPPVDVEGDWGFTLAVAGPAGSGTSGAPLTMGIDPHAPPASLGYRLSQIAIPVVTVLLLLAFFRLRGIELERRPSDRSETADRSRASPHHAP